MKSAPTLEHFSSYSAPTAGATAAGSSAAAALPAGTSTIAPAHKNYHTNAQALAQRKVTEVLPGTCALKKVTIVSTFSHMWVKPHPQGRGTSLQLAKGK